MFEAFITAIQQNQIGVVLGVITAAAGGSAGSSGASDGGVVTVNTEF